VLLASALRFETIESEEWNWFLLLVPLEQHSKKKSGKLLGVTQSQTHKRRRGPKLWLGIRPLFFVNFNRSVGPLVRDSVPLRLASWIGSKTNHQAAADWSHFLLAFPAPPINLSGWTHRLSLPVFLLVPLFPIVPVQTVQLPILLMFPSLVEFNPFRFHNKFHLWLSIHRTPSPHLLSQLLLLQCSI